MIPWIFFSLLAAACWALSNVIDKFALTGFIKNPTKCTILSNSIGLVIAVCLLLFVRVQVLPISYLVICFFVGSLYLCATWLYFHVLFVTDVTDVSLNLQLVPIFTIFFSRIFLHENITTSQYIGAFFVLLASLTVSQLHLITIEKARTKSLLLIAISCILFSFSWILSKGVLYITSYWTLFFWSRIGSFLLMFTIFVFTGSKNIFCVNKSTGLIYLSESLNFTGILFSFVALTSGTVSLVSTITAAQPFFVFLFSIVACLLSKTARTGMLSLSELIKKLAAFVLVIIGIYLVSS